MLFFCVVVCQCVVAQNKSLLFRSTKTCYTDKRAALVEATKKLKPLKDELVKEGKLIYSSDEVWNEDKNFKYATFDIAENQAKYDAALKEFNKKANERFPEAFKVIADACYKTKDTVTQNTKLMPVFKSSLDMAVETVENVDEYPDPTLTYNIIVDLKAFSAVDENKNKRKVDSVQINWGLFEIGRIYNLHVVAGVPKNKINIVLAVHGFSIYSLLNNEAYQKRYKTDNPNLDLIKDLSNAGVRFLVCGQAMTWGKVKKEDLVSQAKVTVTAQTTLTSYQLKGYAIMKKTND